MKEDEVREFMTDWFGPGFEPMPMLAWSVRKRASLTGSGKSKRFVPAFRPFDMLAKPNDRLLVFENETPPIRRPPPRRASASSTWWQRR